MSLPHIKGEVDRAWRKDDVSKYSEFLASRHWTLKEGGQREACSIFDPPRPMKQILRMVKTLKGRSTDK